MRVVIAGCGRVGALLSMHLSLDGHEVALIDKDPAAFRRLPHGFTGTTHRGHAFDRAALIEAGIEHADAFVSVTSGDNSNVVSALVAKEVFRVPRVVARIYDPHRAEIYRRFGVPAVSSVAWSVGEVLSLLLRAGIAEEATFGDGEVRLISATVPSVLAGRPIAELNRPGETHVVAVVRAGRSFVPASGELLEADDVVHVAVTEIALPHVERMLAP